MNSRSCYAHHICGSLLTEDVTVLFRRLQNIFDDKERSVIAAYHFSDLLFWLLKKQMTQFSSLYDGLLTLVSSMRPGSSVAVMISFIPKETIKQMTINRGVDTESDES